MKASIVFICIVLLGIQFCICDDAPSPAEPLDQVKEDIKKALMNFSLKLNKYLHEQTPEKNVIIAPVSIYSALSLAFLGSDGETKNEFLSALGFSSHTNELEKVHSTLGSLFKMAQNSTTANLTIAASIFLQSSLSLHDAYKQDVQKYYESSVTPVDFAAGNDGATNAINAWVNEKTHGKIPKLYEETIDPQTVAILASALYFEAEWMHHFSPALTQPGVFHAAGNKDVHPPMMWTMRTIPFHYCADHKYTAIAMPYVDNYASMVIVKPFENSSIPELINTFDANELNTILESHSRYVHYTIPKFNLNYQQKLVDAMKSFGVESAFGDKANFGKMLTMPIYLHDIKHITKLEVNEFGTVGAAITGIDAFPMSMPIQFTANQPFLFFIVHHESKSVIFSGVINDPTQG